MKQVKAVVSLVSESLVTFDEIQRQRYALRKYTNLRPLYIPVLDDIVKAFDSIGMGNVSLDIQERIVVFKRMLDRAYHGYSMRDVRRYWLSLRKHIEYIVLGISKLLKTLPVDSKNVVLYIKESDYVLTIHMSNSGQINSTLRCPLTGYPFRSYECELGNETHVSLHHLSTSIILPSGPTTTEQY